MRVLAITFISLLKILLLPFALLDYFVLKYPVERRADKWRKTIKLGDKAYFVNMLGTQTSGEVVHLFEDGEVTLRTSNGQGSHSRKSLYPVKEEI